MSSVACKMSRTYSSVAWEERWDEYLGFEAKKWSSNLEDGCDWWGTVRYSEKRDPRTRPLEASIFMEWEERKDKKETKAMVREVGREEGRHGVFLIF